MFVVFDPHPRCPAEPPEPPPTPMSGSIRSRANSPFTPLNPAEVVSYGSAPGNDSASATESQNRESEEESIQDGEDRKTWHSRVVQFMTSGNSPYLLLENSGSVARDHLASERTFLAYVRTSLASASAGVGESYASRLGNAF